MIPYFRHARSFITRTKSLSELLFRVSIKLCKLFEKINEMLYELRTSLLLRMKKSMNLLL